MSDETWVVALPKLGESVTEGVIGNIFKQVGDEVAFDDPLFEVATDKVDSEIPSPYDGVILEVLVSSGDTVPVGAPVLRIGGPGATVENRLPSAAPAVAAAGGRSLAEPSAPSMGGSEGPAIEAAGVGAPAGALYELTMPKLGESVTEGTIGTWLKQVGDVVAFDDPLFEVSTDKVDSEIPSPYDGTLLEILVPAGDTVPVGTVLARIGDASGAAAPAASSAPPPSSPGSVSVPSATAGNGHGRLLSPLVRRLIADHGLDASAITGTGAGGRIRREDVQTAIAAGTARPAPTVAPVAPVAAAPATATVAAPKAVKGTADSRDEVVPLSRMRLILSDTLKASQTLAASVWTSVEVDFHNIDQVRAKFKAQFKKDTGASLSYLPFISRAVCDALRVFPTVNSSIDLEAKTMTLHPYVNLGIAVDLDEQGLVVPVVKGADGLNIRGIASEIASKAAAARAKELPNKEMTGSTFTITNPGPFSSYASSPIINQPNVAILCTDGVKRRPVAVGDAIAIHPVGIIGLVYDHRAFDGSTASKFLLHLRDSLEQRDWAAELS
ncbi:2-oxo acid dehydrogenase subunit E2 [Mycolicibacterium sp.]|uniref:2-oxo acid dehydrogenase subunit E2 n=1 Tax=Mycolicibacterium sp. TaxID=2320850 RepID=UPI0037C7A2DC